MLKTSLVYCLSLVLTLSSASVHRGYPPRQSHTKQGHEYALPRGSSEKEGMSYRPCLVQASIQSRSVDGRHSAPCCEPKTYMYHLNHDPENFLLRPSVAAVDRCSGSCDSNPNTTEKRCLPTHAGIQKRNVTVQKLKINKTADGPDSVVITVEVEDHIACFCGAYSLQCVQSQPMNKKKCENKSVKATRPYWMPPDYYKYTWSANECICHQERFYYR